MLEPPRLPPDPPRRHDDFGPGKQAGMSVALEGLGCAAWGCFGSMVALAVIAVAAVVALLLI